MTTGRMSVLCYELLFAYFLCSSALGGETENVGQITEFNQPKTQAAIKFPLGYILKPGDILKLESESKGTKDKKYFAPNEPCLLTVKETKENNLTLSKQNDNIVIVSLAQCKTSSTL